MGRRWVLDTDTKGTGARMVPLDEVQERARRRPDPEVIVPAAPRERREPDPGPRPPRRFRVVDVLSREVLAEGASTRATVDLLEGVRSVVDVNVSAWDEDAGAWRLLTLDEKRVLWSFRGRSAPAP